MPLVLRALLSPMAKAKGPFVPPLGFAGPWRSLFTSSRFRQSLGKAGPWRSLFIPPFREERRGRQPRRGIPPFRQSRNPVRGREERRILLRPWRSPSGKAKILVRIEDSHPGKAKILVRTFGSHPGKATSYEVTGGIKSKRQRRSKIHRSSLKVRIPRRGCLPYQ
jgi:hypothetical protein